MTRITDYRVEMEIPWPPSVNHMYVRTRRGMFLSKTAQAFRSDVSVSAVRDVPYRFDGTLSVSLHLHPPDNRLRDVDNVIKSTLDALQHAGVYETDNHVAELHVYRMAPRKPDGMVRMVLNGCHRGVLRGGVQATNNKRLK